MTNITQPGFFAQINKNYSSLIYVKYNNAGQLFCVLCNAPVKNELLWNAHIQSKKHKEVNKVMET